MDAVKTYMFQRLVTFLEVQERPIWVLEDRKLGLCARIDSNRLNLIAFGLKFQNCSVNIVDLRRQTPQAACFRSARTSGWGGETEHLKPTRGPANRRALSEELGLGRWLRATTR